MKHAIVKQWCDKMPAERRRAVVFGIEDYPGRATNGRPAGGLGDTADVVHYAESLKKNVRYLARGLGPV